jgi:hypothetical protein
MSDKPTYRSVNLNSKDDMGLRIAELEHELAEAKGQIKDLTYIATLPDCSARRELIKTREQRDALADALRALKELGPPSKAKDIITTALTTLEGRTE